METNTVMRRLKKIALMITGSVLLALNINTFVNTGGLYPAGVTGITILLQHVSDEFFGIHLPYTLVNIMLNAFPVYIGFRFIGKKYTVNSVLVIVMTSILVDILPDIVITYDTLLISIFGGIISGFATSLCLWGDANTGGTDFISIYISEKKGIDAWNIILGFNAVVLCTAGLLFGWDKALYSIIYQFTSTQVIRILYREYQQMTLIVVTDHPQEVCSKIAEIGHHSATILNGKGYHDGNDKAVVYSVITRAQQTTTVSSIKELDPDAFINAIRTDRLDGRFYHRPYN